MNTTYSTPKTGDKFYRYDSSGLHVQTFLQFDDGPFGKYAVVEREGRIFHSRTQPLQNWSTTETEARKRRLQELQEQSAVLLLALQDASNDYDATENEIIRLTITKTEV